MIRASYRNGVLQPLDPVPTEWSDGRELNVEPAERAQLPDAAELERINEWYRELQALGAARYEPGEYEELQRFLAEADELAKEHVRREMGL